MMRIAFETVTPEIAKEWLTHNVKNRTVSPNRINMFVSDMKNGKWEEASLDPISFSPCGQLLNGQHRLMSIVRAGVTLNMMVAYDVPESAVFDRGMERNSYSELYMRGIISRRFTTWDTKAIVNYTMFCSVGRNNFSDSERASFIQDNESLLEKTFDIVRVGHGKIKGNKNISKRAPVASAIFFALKWGVPDDVLCRFSEIVSSGFMSDESESAAIVCRNYLINPHLNKNSYHEKLNDMKITEMAIRDFVCGKPRKIAYRNIEHVFVNMRENCGLMK